MFCFKKLLSVLITNSVQTVYLPQKFVHLLYIYTCFTTSLHIFGLLSDFIWNDEYNNTNYKNIKHKKISTIIYVCLYT